MVKKTDWYLKIKFNVIDVLCELEYIGRPSDEPLTCAMQWDNRTVQPSGI